MWRNHCVGGARGEIKWAYLCMKTNAINQLLKYENQLPAMLSSIAIYAVEIFIEFFFFFALFFLARAASLGEKEIKASPFSKLLE